MFPSLHPSTKVVFFVGTIFTVETEVKLQTVCKLHFSVLVQPRVDQSYKTILYSECGGRVELIDAYCVLFEIVLVSLV